GGRSRGSSSAAAAGTRRRTSRSLLVLQVGDPPLSVALDDLADDRPAAPVRALLPARLPLERRGGAPLARARHVEVVDRDVERLARGGNEILDLQPAAPHVALARQIARVAREAIREGGPVASVPARDELMDEAVDLGGVGQHREADYHAIIRRGARRSRTHIITRRRGAPRAPRGRSR